MQSELFDEATITSAAQYRISLGSIATIFSPHTTELDTVEPFDHITLLSLMNISSTSPRKFASILHKALPIIDDETMSRIIANQGILLGNQVPGRNDLRYAKIPDGWQVERRGNLYCYIDPDGLNRLAVADPADYYKRNQPRVGILNMQYPELKSFYTLPIGTRLFKSAADLYEGYDRTYIAILSRDGKASEFAVVKPEENGDLSLKFDGGTNKILPDDFFERHTVRSLTINELMDRTRKKLDGTDDNNSVAGLNARSSLRLELLLDADPRIEEGKKYNDDLERRRKEELKRQEEQRLAQQKLNQEILLRWIHECAVMHHREKQSQSLRPRMRIGF